MVNFFAGMTAVFGPDQRDAMLSVTSISFDISVLELLWTLCEGVQVIIHPSDVMLNGLDRYLPQEDLSMDMSLFFFANYNHDQKVNKYKLLLESVKYADASGFSAVWTPERHFHEFGGLYPNPAITSAALSSVTQNLEIRSGSVVSPLHDIINLAQEWSVVDNLSNGRASLSFVAGWNPDDFVISKEQFSDRHKVMYEQIEILRKLWAGETVERTNESGDTIEFSLPASPLRKDMPIWVTAANSEMTFRKAGEVGANLLTHLLGQDITELGDKIRLYREERKRMGFGPGKVAVMLHTYVGEDLQEVEKTVEAPFKEYLRSSIGLSRVLFAEAGLSEDQITEELKETILDTAFRRYIKTSSLIGTKASCGEMIRRIKAIGADEIACLIDFGVDQEKVLESMVHLRELKQLFSKEKTQHHRPVTMMQSTPSFLKMASEDIDSTRFLQSLKNLLVGGEPVTADLVNAMRERLDAEIFNMYGPTETTIWSSVKHFDQQVEKVSIGSPIANTQIYILNNELQPMPVGVAGAVYIGGDGLSSGYWKRDDLTSERFIPNPFIVGERIYNTGDVGKWLSDGTIELSGRQDQQVKIRGYRIELGEIESVLLSYPDISEAIVNVTEDKGEKLLVSYTVSRKKIVLDRLREHLAASLPYYMVPAYFVELEALPLTPNKKVDRKALPDPTTEVVDFVSPATEKETILANIWADVLGLSEVGVTDNFFALGGDSIKSIQISSRARKEGFQLAVKDIFNYLTVRSLAPKLKTFAAETDQSPVTGTSALTPIQQWFFDGRIQKKHHFNQAVSLQFAHPISSSLVLKIFTKLQTHHDALRMTFKEVDGRVTIESKGIEMPVSLEERDLTGIQDAEAKFLEEAESLQSGIDLEQGPLMKLGLFLMPEGSRLLIVIHHLVVDGISWRILLEDIEDLYQQAVNNETLSLPLKTDSFQSWSGSLDRYRQTTVYAKSRAYWIDVLKESKETIRRDYPEQNNALKDRKTHLITLDKEYTARLLADAHKPFGTQVNDIMLAALVMTVNQLYGHSNICIDLEGHGREDILATADISRTVGWFSSIYPVFLNYHNGALSELLKGVKERLRKVPNKGLDYLLYQYGDEDRSNSETQPVSQIFFNYLGQFETDATSDSFTVSDQGIGEVVSIDESWNYDWDFLGKVAAGTFEMQVAYSAKQYKQQSMATVMTTFKDSLMQLIDYCCQYNGVELTPSDLSYSDLTMSQLDFLQKKYEIKDVYTLSPLQEGLLFHALQDEASDQYFLQISYQMTGKLDLKVVEQSINDIIVQYDVLRTIFIYEGVERPVQVVLDERKIDFVHLDVRDQLAAYSVEELVKHYQESERSRKFNLDEDLLLRITVLQTAEVTYQLIWSYHHILMDGWCIGIILQDFRRIYQEYITTGNSEPLKLTSYATYIQWLEERDKQLSTDYWKNYLSGYDNQAGIPEKNYPVQDQSYALRQDRLNLTRKQTADLLQVSRDAGVTINTLIQCAWGILLSRYNNANDVVFGIVVAGRPSELPDVEDMVGLFINTVPIRISYEKEETLERLLKRTQESALESDPHHYHPLSEIQGLSTSGRDLINHILVFDNYPIQEEIQQSEDEKADNDLFEIENVDVFEQTNYDLSIAVVPGDEMYFKLDYNANKYHPDTIAKVLRHLNKLLAEITSGVGGKVVDLEMLTKKETNNLITTFNQTTTAPSEAETVLSLFQKQVEKAPTNIALSAGDQTMTYQELDELSSQVANYLQTKHHLQPGDLVAVLLDRELYFIPFIYGILKAGGYFLPIDTNFPVKWDGVSFTILALLSANTFSIRISSAS
ncbi:MAG: MupA/Atu3671 family FMN-dependent luciferase-like monooxygenase [Bacteroidota bacterium]